MEECIFASDNQVMEGDNDTESEFEGEEEEGVPKTIVFESSRSAKLKDLLHKINSIEIKLFSDATKDFVKLLKTDAGAELLHLYIETSPSLSELLEAWKLRQGKPGMSYVLSLISAILSHPEGRRYNDKLGVSRVLDKFARLIVDEKLEDVYRELNTKDGKRQNDALLLMGSVVRRGSGLASEVAKKFDFKLQGFSKLSEYKKRKQIDKKKHSTRKSFVGFAMSFLEMGKPGLLRWVLQQREMYSRVLRGLGNDDDETVTYILSTLCDRVLTEESLVPPGLRSVLFGSVTLEQLVNISGRQNRGVAVELAYRVLVMVCTDPSNGLMPDLERKPNPLKGNPKRLLGVMKKLKATEIGYHKDLLLATLRGRPSLGAAYMDEFPYSVEDHASPTWVSTVSLAASLISSVAMGNPFGFLDAKSHDPPSFDSVDVQNIINCICPHPLSRSVVTKGLLHSDFLVKHGALRLLLEALKLLDSFISSLNNIFLVRNQMMQSWALVKQDIQNEVRTLLPDTQVLLTLLSSLGTNNRTPKSSLKRKFGLEKFPDNSSLKKLKAGVLKEDSDIIVGGISSVPDVALPDDHDVVADAHVTDELDIEKEFLNVISDIWGLDLCSSPVMELKDVEMYFYSKLLDALKIYLRTVPTVLEGSFDFFMNLVNSPLALPIDLQRSLLALLIEYIGWSPGNGKSNRIPLLMYKHLHTFINLLTLSPNSDIKNQAYNLARAAMLSTGAFDRNPYEIGAWFLFLPGYRRNKLSVEVQGVEVLQSLSQVVVSFLGDAISTIGNNLFKHWDIVRQYISRLKGFKGISPNFSPLIVCALDKCIRLLNSSSGTFSLSEKSMISLYVCNTLKYLLQTQVDAGLLSDLVQTVLSEGLGDCRSMVYDSGDLLCEWRPLKNLFYFSQSAWYQPPRYFLSIDKNAIPDDSSFAITLGEVKKFIGNEQHGELTGIVKAFYSAMLCATPEDILINFPLVMTISLKLGVAVPLLSSIIFSEQNFLVGLSNIWPEVFVPGLEMAFLEIHQKGKDDDEGMTSNIDFDMIQSAAAAFSLFLKQVPFHVLFPATISIDAPYLSESSKIQDLLLSKRQKSSQRGELHPSSAVMSRVLMSTPVEMVSHCIYRTSIAKAKLLHLLIEMSPLHLSIFGQLFLSILNKIFFSNGILMKEISGYALSDDNFMMLLPAALSLVNSAFVKFEKHFYRHFKSIPSFYSRMLLNGFVHWKSFVSGDIFQEEYSEFLPSSAQELFNLVDESLLGKAIHLLRYHFFLSGDSLKLKKRLELFNSIFAYSVTHEELLDCGVSEMDFSSVNKSLNHINKVVVKISFCKMLLFPEDDKVLFLPKEEDGGLREISLTMGSNKADSSRMHFMDALVGAWQWMVKKLPLIPEYSISIIAKSGDCLCLYRCLEVFILRNILQLTRKMHSYLILLQSIPFVEQLMRSTLLYRFEDSKTLGILRSILILLSEGKFSRVLCLQMLLGHSQFAPMIHSISKSSTSETGTFFRPMSSILRLLVVPDITSNVKDGKDDQEAAEMCVKQLEILKLLRTLLLSGAAQSDFDSRNDSSINLKELHLLLLSSYGATLSEIDLEMYSLINEIETIDSSDSKYIAEIDYLWGSAAMKVRKEHGLEHGASRNIMTDIEAAQECRKIKYRENLPVDPKVCAATVLHFPYDRTASDRPLSLNKLQSDNIKDMIKLHSPGAGNIQRYDPVFIMRFSIHSLSAGYIEPVEFAGLGLLAVAFVSMSSLDVGMRKLAYEVLSRFKISLEILKKSVQLHKMVRYLVEQCSLFSWLSSILSNYSRVLLGDENRIFLTELVMVIEVVTEVISSKDITEWLQSCALEQLMELASHLYKLLVGGMKLINEHAAFVNPTLQIIISTLKMSQKRQMYQPHFTLSLEGLFQIYRAVNEHDIGRYSGNAECGLEAILTSTPPIDMFCMDREKLSSFLIWATSTALKSESRKMFQCKESGLYLPVILEEASHEESLTLKLLRWLTASIIHGKLSWKFNDWIAKFSDRSNSKTLQSLLEYVPKGDKEGNKSSFYCEEMLAAQVFYLQQSLGINCSALPSVISALCLLLCDDSKVAGLDFMLDFRTSMVTLCSMICCPPESYPAWRWSFDQPWKDHSSELTDLERIDELHACQKLLVMISNVLWRKSSDFLALSLQAVENCGVLKWERSIIETE
ncbi:Nucleolar pre-ribosomal-associated protein 1 [Theobroma cacao]|nr:Nucleolar pre-ribosomal-associated protein 1 [Theobroma cacao]